MPGPRHRTTIYISAELWKTFLKMVVEKYGSARRTSEEIESIIKAYVERGRRS